MTVWEYHKGQGHLARTNLKRISGLLFVYLLLLHIHPAVTQETVPSRDALESRITELRQAAAFTEAAVMATELVELLRQDPGSKVHEIADAERLLVTLEHIAGLSKENQQELAAAHVLQSEIRLAYRQADYHRAIELAERQLSIWETFLDSEHYLVATFQNTLAMVHYAQGHYAQAEPLWELALATREKVLGPNHPDFAQSLNNLANLYRTQGRLTEAEPLWQRSLAFWEQTSGPDHPEVARILNNLAILYRAQGRYAEVEPLWERALTIREKALGPDHLDVAASLSNLAVLYRDQGRYAEAESMHKRALAIREQTLGPDHPDLARSLNNIAVLYSVQGRYAEAASLYERVLAIREQVLGPDHPDIAASLSNLALLYHDQGHYAQAEPLLEHALALREQVFGPKHPAVAASLDNLAILHLDQGRYAEAQPLLERALAVSEQALGPDHPDVASCLNSLGSLYHSQGRYDEAEPLWQRSLAIWEQTLGPDHLHLAASLNNIANLYRDQGRYTEVEPLSVRALAIREQALGPEHPDIAQSLHNLAALYHIQGRYGQAEHLWERALLIQEQALGPDHPHITLVLNSLATLNIVQNQYAQSLPYLARAAQVFEAARLRVGEGLERATFQESPYPALAAMHLLTADPTPAWPAAERDQGRVLADLLFRSKERQLTDLETAREDSLRRLLDGLENRLTAGLDATAGDTEEEREAGYRDLRVQHLATQAEWSRFQRAMAEQYPVTEGQIFALDRVQAALAPGEAYIGWLDVEARRDSLASWAYVVRAEGPVDWVSLDAEAALQSVASLLAGSSDEGGQSALERLARAHARNLTDRDTPQLVSSRIAAAFCAARLGPVLPLLEDIEHLIVIPTGVMASIPAESLIDQNGRYLGDRFTISYIPSATIYTWLQEEQQTRQAEPALVRSTLLVGDPPFSVAQHEAMTRVEPPLVLAATGLSSLDETVLREARAGSPEALGRLPRLPGTRAEVMAIAAIADGPHKLIGPEACEQELTRLATSGELKQFRTIHLATHALADQQHPERSCLILSQVGLPDALEQVRKGQRLYDGRLTVQEILREWRLDADLVTLSACETGLGRQVRGEGVVGFAHAFLQVGARSLLVSLWPVEDRATALLMERFYANWWQRKMGRAEALREAKVWLREYTDTGGRKPYAHPFFWSAFVLVGERG